MRWKWKEKKKKKKGKREDWVPGKKNISDVLNDGVEEHWNWWMPHSSGHLELNRTKY